MFGSNIVRLSKFGSSLCNPINVGSFLVVLHLELKPTTDDQLPNYMYISEISQRGITDHPCIMYSVKVTQIGEKVAKEIVKRKKKLTAQNPEKIDVGCRES